MSRDICYIIVLNYEGYNDTIQCLESLRFSKEEKCKVIVIDNASKDESVAVIDDWCKEEFQNDYQGILPVSMVGSTKINKWITLCTSEENNGFSAGNNIGIRLALSQDDCQSLFILNNDTVVSDNIIKVFRENLIENPYTGIFSLKLINYYDENMVQFDNQMHFCKPFARITPKEPDIKGVKQPDFYSGAAFFVTREFVEKVGFMDERYFLFYEELDWVMAARKYSFYIQYMDDAVVKHKCSVTTGKQPAFSQFCFTRSSLLFTKKYHPWWLITVLIFSLLRSVKHFLKGDEIGGKAIAYAAYCYMRYPQNIHLDKYRRNMIFHK